mmetsp:Transcript_123263/g.345043  ORF Transcript_123263/g.345043 Transcript_123263/m.345043 type:complete len:97 (+) Transcript_123263:70-360(+)
MSAHRLLAALLAPGLACSQQLGTVVPEASPPMRLERCTVGGGCKVVPAAVTLDANWRWVHEKTGYDNCFGETGWSSEFCPAPSRVSMQRATRRSMV